MIRYVVRPGDTLYDLARRYNTTVSRIVQLNNLSNQNAIYAGQVLLIDTGSDTGNQSSWQQPGPSPGGNYNTAFIDGLRYTISTDRTTYTRGDNVRITLTKCNVSSRAIILRYNTGQRFDFAAFRDGREVWRWSDGRFFAQVTGRVVLEPGNCMSETVTWDLRNQRGNYVALDTFQIRGYNVANNLRNRYVPVNIRVAGAVEPGPGGECPSGNLLRDPGIESWSNANNPVFWSGENLYRTTIRRSGRYAAELGAIHNRRAVLSQTVNVIPGRIYRVNFWARENVQPGRVGNFSLEVEILLYNRQGRFISRVDPVYTPRSIPNNNYQQYSFTTGTLPREAERAALRFVFQPRFNNDNTVKIDDVIFRCFR